MDSIITTDVAVCAHAIQAGHVVAYPTEGVYGLGCDPANEAAFKHLFALKQRPQQQGVLLLGASLDHVAPWLDERQVPEMILTQVYATWPGPSTWIFPRNKMMPTWVAGDHAGIALRVTAHKPAAALCQAAGMAIVSTSANIHGQPPGHSAAAVKAMFPQGLGAILDAPLGGLSKPTPIRDALTGTLVRA